jgi:hypothetical protein
MEKSRPVRMSPPVRRLRHGHDRLRKQELLDEGDVPPFQVDQSPAISPAIRRVRYVSTIRPSGFKSEPFHRQQDVADFGRGSNQ